LELQGDFGCLWWDAFISQSEVVWFSFSYIPAIELFMKQVISRWDSDTFFSPQWAYNSIIWAFKSKSRIFKFPFWGHRYYWETNSCYSIFASSSLWPRMFHLRGCSLLFLKPAVIIWKGIPQVQFFYEI